MRAQQRQSRHEPVDPESHSFLLEPSVEDQYIDDEYSLNRKKLVEQILSSLPPRQKEIIYYRYLQELDFDEICTLMQLNYQSAQNLLQRAIKKIREQFL